MRLQHITDQGGSLDDYYAACSSPDDNDDWVTRIAKIRKLLRHLEDNVEGPSQWVTISHATNFYLSDEDDGSREKARVFVSLVAYGFGYGYEIRLRSKWHDWDSFVLLEARGEVEAGNMIAAALWAGRSKPG